MSFGLNDLRSESRGNPIPECLRLFLFVDCSIQLDLNEFVLPQYVIEMLHPFRCNHQLLYGLFQCCAIVIVIITIIVSVIDVGGVGR